MLLIFIYQLHRLDASGTVQLIFKIKSNFLLKIHLQGYTYDFLPQSYENNHLFRDVVVMLW